MAIEAESKIYIGHIDNPTLYLQQKGATVIKPRVYEHNIRYENATQSFQPNGIVLRLRQDRDVRLTYKSPLDDQRDGIVRRQELETTIGDHQTMNAILEALGYQPYMIYEKYRTTYHFDDLPNTEIVLDEMPYGTFIEVEGNRIEQALQRLGLQDLPRLNASYAELFEDIRAHHGLSFTDLTFANFEGISIDNSIFS